MRTTLTIDDDVFQAAQAQAQASGKKLGTVISLLARRGLKAAAETTARKGLPVFKVGKDAPIIPSNRARELLADDAT
jgi:hypothetical protein